MKLSEAIRITDDTVGMFRTFLEIMDMGQLGDEFLKFPVKTSVDQWVDLENSDAGIACRQYYTYIADDGEHKNYVVDIHPVCNYMIDEWPSPTAKKIKKLLKQNLFLCLDFCKDILGEDNLELNLPFEENYNYQRKYGSSKNPHMIVDVIFDTIHAMYHAIGVVEEFDEGTVSDPQGEAIEDEKDAAIIEKLKPIFWGDEEQIKSFLEKIRGKKNTAVIDVIAKGVKDRIISEQSCHRDLWKILHETELYKATESNYNLALKNKRL